jgi:hypothetical protein
MSESADGCPVDAKRIHVRVTLGYLRSIERSEKSQNSRARQTDSTSSLVTAFASLDPRISGEHNFAPSMPLSATSNVSTVIWPKQKHSTEETVDKSNRRLYFTTTLQRDSDYDAELQRVLTTDDDVSAVTGTSGWNNEEVVLYAPKVINIQLGVARGKDLLHLGVATMVVDGTDVSGKQMDLPVRTLLPGEDDNSSNKGTPKRRGLRRLFGKKSNALQSAFASDEYDYMFTPNALLRVRVDVISDTMPLAAQSQNGPAVWGDGIEDDNDSYASIVVMDLADEKAPPPQEKARSKEDSRVGGSLASMEKDVPESIEVLNNPTGPSIISTSTPVYVEPEVLDLESRPSYRSIAPLKSVTVKPQETFSPTSQCSDVPSSLALSTTGMMMCGFTEVFSGPAIEADASGSLTFEDSSTIATSQYKGTRGEDWKKAARKKSASSIAASSGFFEDRTLDTLDERTEDDDTSRASYSRASQSRATYSRASRSRMSGSRASYAGSMISGGSLSIGEDTMKSLDEAKKALQMYAQRTGENVRDMLEILDTVSTSDIFSLEQSVGEDTIDSVIEAKELLQTYARRVGVDVEDLLDMDLSKDLAEYLSPTTTLSADETEISNTSSKASSNSRFSLFIDEDE